MKRVLKNLLANKILDKESALEKLRVKRMNLNIKVQMVALDTQEKNDISKMRDKIESDNNIRIDLLIMDILKYKKLNV